MAADLAGAHQKTVGADKNYDTKGFVAEMRRIGVTPHVAQNTARSGGSAIPSPKPLIGPNGLDLSPMAADLVRP